MMEGSLLAIDTSTEYAGLALIRGEELISELNWRTGQSHSVELLPNLIYTLNLAKVERSSIAAVVVARGPGSFNGLRVGMSVAKGLAVSLDVPLVGVSTLEAEALPFAESGLPLLSLHNAGRGEVAAALFQSRDGIWSRLVEEHITTLETLCSNLEGRVLFCGELTPAIMEEITERMGEGAVIGGAAARLRRAAAVALLGYRRLQKGERDDPATLQPLYLRRPPITQPRPRSTLTRRERQNVA